jgi:hypothetical protein
MGRLSSMMRTRNWLIGVSLIDVVLVLELRFCVPSSGKAIDIPLIAPGLLPQR